MIKVENRSKEEISEIGRRIGEAFAAEKEGLVTLLPPEQTVKMFEIITDYYYRSGVLYSISEKGEGYVAYWEKKAKPPAAAALRMIKRFLCEMPPKVWLAVSKSGGDQYAKVFRKEQDYIVVSMAVVLREFQGKGLMHRILGQPFDEADAKNIPCVLDTDTPLKVKKYILCGMQLCSEKKLKKGLSLYTLTYRRIRS